MFPVKRKVEKVVDSSLIGRLANAIILVLGYGFVTWIAMPSLLECVSRFDVISMPEILAPMSFGGFFLFLFLAFFASSAIPAYRALLVKEVENPNPLISW